jgi:hypothetical protein
MSKVQEQFVVPAKTAAERINQVPDPLLRGVLSIAFAALPYDELRDGDLRVDGRYDDGDGDGPSVSVSIVLLGDSKTVEQPVLAQAPDGAAAAMRLADAAAANGKSD